MVPTYYFNIEKSPLQIVRNHFDGLTSKKRNVNYNYFSIH